MSEQDQVAISRMKIEMLERHAKWFIEECKAGRILHIRDDSDLERHGLIRAATHKVLRDEFVRLTSQISDDDVTFLEDVMGGANVERQEQGAIALHDPVADHDPPNSMVDDGEEEDEAMIEDALNEIISLRQGEDDITNPFSTRRVSTVTPLDFKPDP